MKKFSLSALAAAGVLAGGFATSASAADLGGNCCADLEERIAELEATTARKGNRKVSLTVSGWVNQQVTWWDDGEESNVYVHDLGSTLGSHFKFTGSANITPGWSAGYVLQVEGMSSDGLTTDQDTDNGPGALGGNVQLLQSYWFIKSEQLGKVSIGRQSQASDNTAILVDGSGSLLSANWVSFDVNSFFTRDTAGNRRAVRWGAAGGCVWGDCNGAPENAVRYDTPTFGGFSMSASWGEDDFWDVAGRYAGEFGGFKLAAAAAYSESTDVDILQPEGSDYFQAGLYIQHVGTGLFALGNYGHLDLNIAGREVSETWYVKGGLRQRFSPLGATVFYGEYLENADGFADNSELQMWGLGVVQEIDAAAMSMWIKYRNVSADNLADAGGAYDADDFQWVGFGALINF